MGLPTDLTNRKTRVGRVVGTRMDKTAVVEVVSYRRHRIYKKLERRTERVLAHDEENRCVVGDEVRIVESRPMSRRKRWIVGEILTKGYGEMVKPAEIDETVVAGGEAS